MIRAATHDGLVTLVLFIPTADQHKVLYLSTQAISSVVSGWQPTWRTTRRQPTGGDHVITAAFEQSVPYGCMGFQCGIATGKEGTLQRFQLGPHLLAEATNPDINTLGLPLIHAPLTGNPVIVDMGIIEYEGGESSKTLLVPTTEGGITHFVTTRQGRWERKAQIAKELGLVSGLAALRSNFGTPGNIEVVCRAGDKMYDFAWVCSTNTWTRPCHLSIAF